MESPRLKREYVTVAVLPRDEWVRALAIDFERRPAKCAFTGPFHYIKRHAIRVTQHSGS